MINKICSNPYSHTKFTNFAQKPVSGALKKYIGLPLAAFAFAGSSALVSSCMVDVEDDDKVTFYTCPYDSTQFNTVCGSTPERIDVMLKTLRIIPNSLSINNISSISYSEGENKINYENIEQDANGNIHCYKIKTDKNGIKDTTVIDCKNVPGKSLSIGVNENTIKNGEIQAGESKYIFQSPLESNTFLTRNLSGNWLYALYPKSGAVITETPEGEKQTLNAFSYTEK